MRTEDVPWETTETTEHTMRVLGTNAACFSFFSSSFQPLSHDRLNTLRTKLSHLMLLIVDEVSMVGANMLPEILKQLQQIKGASDGVASN